MNFGNLGTPEVVCEVTEGDITGVEVQYLDGMGQLVEGNTDERIVMRELPIEVCAERRQNQDSRMSSDPSPPSRRSSKGPSADALPSGASVQGSFRTCSWGRRYGCAHM